MRRTRGSEPARWALAVLALSASLVTSHRSALAHGLPGTDEVLTRFEQFLLEACSPCVKESAPIATLQVGPMKLPAWSRTMGVRTTRAGEISVEALRSYLLGRPSRQLLAVRITLSVATGNPGEMYRMASGIVDDEEAEAFANSLGEIAQAASASPPPDAGADPVEMDLHSGSVRVGVIRLKGEATVYVQAGDIRVLARRPIWDAPGTLYLPIADLTSLKSAIAQAATKIRKMRSGP